MKIAVIIVLVAFIIWTILSWLSVRNIEEPKYEVLSSNNVYQVRLYKPYIIAETKVSGSYNDSMNDGFRNIANYIFGNNKVNEKIAMTAPVIEESAGGEKIAMTVPVIEEGDSEERLVSFVMPSKYTLDTIPQPNSDLVTLREIPERKVAVLKYGWYTNESRIEKKREELLNKLQEDGVGIIGEVYSARYNPPFSMPLLLRNEVGVEIVE